MDGVWYVVLHCDGSRLCFQVGNKLKSWFVLVPYSKEYNLLITHRHKLSVNILI